MLDWCLFKLGSELSFRCDIIKVTNRSSDNGFGKSKPRVRFGGMMPLGAESCDAEASHSVMNGFNFRFIPCVVCAPHSPSTGCESTTRVANDPFSGFWFDPKYTVSWR